MKASKRTIYVDMDDVLCHTARRFLAIVEREFGKRITYEQLTDFDIGHACNLQPDEQDELYRIVHESHELLKLEPIAEAIQVLQQWSGAGYEIAIVTGRPPESHDVSLEWLHRNNVPFESFTVVDKYGRFTTDDTIAISLGELRERQFCWAVEDSLPMARYLAEHMAVPVALINCPWNRADAEHDKIARYSTWSEIAERMPTRAPSFDPKKNR